MSNVSIVLIVLILCIAEASTAFEDNRVPGVGPSQAT